MSKIEKKNRETSSIDNLPAVDEDIKLNILLAMGENPYNRVRQVGRDYDISFTSAQTVLKLKKSGILLKYEYKCTRII
jgi:predicted transcriptional regulator